MKRSILMICGWLALSSLTGIQGVTAQDSEPGKNSGSTLLLPVLGYTPDTGVMLGGTILKFFYLEPEVVHSRPSVFSPLAIYTLKNQTIISLGLSLVWDEGRNELGIVPNYFNFPDQFYGIGRDVSLDNEEDFTTENFGVEMKFKRKLWDQWRLGLSGNLMKNRLVKLDADGLLAGGTIRGTGDTWFMGLGPSLTWDSRDNTWAPGCGWWLQGFARFGGSFLGSDTTQQEYTVDLRHYRSLGENTTLAGQLLWSHLAGDDPFFALPKLGGDEGLRGYRGGLYLDHTRALARIEFRRQGLFKKFGTVVFAGIGDVAPAPDQLSLTGRLWSAGFGIRYLFDAKEKVNLRLDFGFGKNDSGFYLSLGEAF